MGLLLLVQLLSDDERVDDGTEQDDMVQDARSVRAIMGGGGGCDGIEPVEEMAAATKEDEDEGMLLLMVVADASEVEVEVEVMVVQLCC